MLAHLAARLAPLSRRGVLSLADEPKDDDDKKSSLRRFETILSADGAADIGNEDVAAEADAASAAISEAEEARAAAAAASQAALDAAAAELSEKVGRLRDILDAQQAVNDEGARLQRAVQRQEEEDSLKMIALLRAQAEAHASELGETKASRASDPPPPPPAPLPSPPDTLLPGPPRPCSPALPPRAHAGRGRRGGDWANAARGRGGDGARR